MDRILLKGIRFYGYHGVYPAERQSGQFFEVDAELYFSFREAAVSDDVADTVDYGTVYQVIAEAFSRDACNLLETVAARLADEILIKFPVVQVVIRVRKPAPPVEGPVDYAEVEVSRSR